jgi:hypothetical protein
VAIGLARLEVLAQRRAGQLAVLAQHVDDDVVVDRRGFDHAPIRIETVPASRPVSVSTTRPW